MHLAVVIPTLDEEEELRRRLPGLVERFGQVVVSDGGSTDATAAVALEVGARLVSGSPGRGVQLNRGAAAADADVIIFLHADTDLPPGTADAVRQAIVAGHPGGGFFVRFEEVGPLLRLGARLINLRSRITRCPLGDQAQFVTREAFAELSGFASWPFLEDLDFARRLKRLGRPALLAPPVTTSPRRFRRQGVARTVATNWLIFGLYFLGVSPHRLARLYGTGR